MTHAPGKGAAEKAAALVGAARRRAAAVALPACALAVLTLLYFHAVSAAVDGTLRVTIVDAATNQPTPARVRITDASGAPVSKKVAGALAIPGEALGVPKEAIAIMYGHDDRVDGYATQPDGAFYVDGRFSVTLPEGEYRVEVSRGYEYVRERMGVTIAPGATLERRASLRRWIDMPARGWYSSDDHIHLRRSPRENPLILRWIAAEDVHVGHLLQMGDFFTTYFTQYAFGESGRYQEGTHLLSPGQEEPRTPELGHTISLGASAYVRPRQRDYYAYDTTFDRVHALGGVTGYAHQGATFHGSRGMTLDVLQGKLDFLELLQFCAPGGPLVTANYYRFLDMGFPLTATAGSDFPWCGRTQAFGAAEDEGPRIGDARFYTYVDGPFTFERWFEALKGGRTFVTSGPMLSLAVDDALPGSTLQRQPGDRLRITAHAEGHHADVPLDRLELVVHGEVVSQVSATAAGQSRERLELSHELTLGAHGLWIAARAYAAPTQAAHTTPIYVHAGDAGFANPETLADNVALSLRYLDEIDAELAAPTSTAIDAQVARHPEGLRQRVAQTRALLARLGASVTRP